MYYFRAAFPCAAGRNNRLAECELMAASWAAFGVQAVEQFKIDDEWLRFSIRIVHAEPLDLSIFAVLQIDWIAALWKRVRVIDGGVKAG